MKRISLLTAVFTFVLAVQAIGPRVPRILTWQPSSSPDATGYCVYWRTNNGNYSDTQRIGVGTNQPVDLLVFGLPRGTYFVMMTATNATSESDPSVEVLWNYLNPNRPDRLVISKP